MIKISVIVPIYNGEKYLYKCIDSILNQSLHDIELILVNDGSTDGSKMICHEYKVIDKRVKIIEQENRGVSFARNRGLEVCNGEYICFIDCDDYIPNNYLEKMYSKCISNNVKMAACNIESITEDNNIIWEKVMNEGIYTKEEIMKELLEFKSFNAGPCGKIFHKSIKEQVKFPNLKTYEDLVFVYRAIYILGDIYYTNEIDYFYIHRDNNSAMQSFIKNPTTDIIKAAYEIIDFIDINMPQIFDTSFYGIISQVMMYLNVINKIDKKWIKNSNKLYIDESQKLLKKYRKKLFINKSIHYKEKILFIIFSYSLNLYKIISRR